MATRGWRSLAGVMALACASRAFWLALALAGETAARHGYAPAAVALPNTLLGTWPVRAAAIFSRWDGQLYLDIAKEGYFSPPLHLRAAFFPLVPMALRLLAWCTGLPLQTCGLWLANGFDLAATALLWRLFCARLGPTRAWQAMGLWIAFPGRYAGYVVGTEGAFLFFGLLAFVAGQKRTLLPRALAAAAATAAGLTRVPGVFVGLGLALDAWRAGRRLWAAVYGVAAAAGPLAFAAYLQGAVGNPWAFLTAQAAWRRTAAWPWTSLLGSAELYDHVAAWLALGALVALWRRRDLASPGEQACAWLSVLLPLCTGRLMSMQRFVSVIFALFLAGATDLWPRRRWRWAYFGYCALVSAALAAKLGFGNKVV